MILGKFSCMILNWIVMSSRYIDLLENSILRRNWSLDYKQLLSHIILKFCFIVLIFFFMESWCCYILRSLLASKRITWENWSWCNSVVEEGKGLCSDFAVESINSLENVRGSQCQILWGRDKSEAHPSAVWHILPLYTCMCVTLTEGEGIDTYIGINQDRR